MVPHDGCARFAKDTPALFDPERTSSLVKIITDHKMIEKVFIEPHLKVRMGLEGNEKVRFHGCHAVRHDDHLHVEGR